jgi:hypothetical protein
MSMERRSCARIAQFFDPEIIEQIDKFADADMRRSYR